MDPIFPKFVPLDLGHKVHIEAFNADLPSYSDFNFTSLWSWNIKNKTSYSMLNDNLVIRLTDYLSGETCYTFHGRHHQQETANQLLNHLAVIGTKVELKLIPETCILGLNNTDLEWRADDSNFDYILEIERLCTFDGSKLKSQRNLVTQFNKTFTPEIRILDLANHTQQAILNEFFQDWINKRRVIPTDAENEFKAFQRFLSLTPQTNLVALALYIDGLLAGFTLNELLPQATVMIHFEKADPLTYPGAYQVLMQETARFFKHQNYQFINYQQDLGLPGLKKCKNGFDPHHYLKKYCVTQKATTC